MAYPPRILLVHSHCYNFMQTPLKTASYKKMSLVTDKEESVRIFSLCVANSNALLANAFNYFW